MQPTSLKLTLACAALGTVIGVAWWGLRRSHAMVDADLIKRQSSFQSMHDVASAARLLPVPSEPGPLSDAVHQALRIGCKDDQIPDDVTASLASTFARTISLRYAHPPAEYVQWMIAGGARLWKKDEVAKFGWDLDATARHYLGDAATGFESGEAQLPLIMAESDRRGGGASRITRISLTAEGWEAAIKRVTPEDPAWPEIPGKIGKAVADGATIASVKTWWAADWKFTKAFDKHGSTYAAFIAGAVECADGKRRNVYLAYVYDVERAVWTCSNIAVVLDAGAKDSGVRFEL